MKRILLRTIFLLSGITLTNAAIAQRYITNTYGYAIYNYFDYNTVDANNNNNTAGVYAPGFSPAPDAASPTSSVVISAAGSGLSLVNTTSGRSLTSTYQSTPKSVYVDNIPNSADAAYKTSLNNNDWEWSLLYRSDLGSGVYPSTGPANSAIVSNSQNAWRYWLNASSSTITSTTGGFYLTQESDGYLRVYAKMADASSGNTAVLCASNTALTNGVTYCIKIQRNVSGYWKMYLDQYTSTVTEAKTLQTTKTNATDLKTVPLTYVASVLEAENKSGSNNIFRWDDMHMYTRYIKYSGVNDPSLGISSNLYGGQGTVVLYGIKIEMRGNYELGSGNASALRLSETDNSGYPPGNFTPSQSGKLYRTTTTPFATGSATLLNSVNFYSPLQVASGGFTDKEVASGNPDGSLSSPVYYFITGTLNSSISSASMTLGAVSSLEQYVYNTTTSTLTPNSTVAPTTSIPITFGTVYDWKGGTTDFWGGHLWSTAANWVQGSVPGSTDVARIGVTAYTTTKIPQINATTTVGSVIIGSNGGNAVVLNLNNDLTGFGTSLTLNNGLTINSSSKLQLVGGSSTFFGATLNLKGTSTIAASGLISSATNTSIVNSGSLYLLSDATSSAAIGALSGTTITNSGSTASTYVQRYLSAVRGYRLLSSPVYTTTASSVNYYNFNYLASSAFISGLGGSANGFDNTAKNNPTLYLYREDVAASSSSFSGGNFKGIEKITAGSNSVTASGPTVLSNGVSVANGYMFYFVGNNTTNYVTKGISSLTPEAVTLSASGTINQGNVPVSLWFNGSSTLSYVHTTTGYNLVGNPYPSTIDWNTNTANGGTGIVFSNANHISEKIFEFDPSTGNYSYFDSSIGANGQNDGGNASRYIGSGQAFFVMAKNASATLTFTENAKAATSQPTVLLMSASARNKQLDVSPQQSAQEPGIIKLRVEHDPTHLDNIGMFFQDGWDAKYNADEDGIDLDGLSASVFLSSYSSDSLRMALNKLPAITGKRIIVPLFMSANAGGLYTFKKLDVSNIPSIYTVWVKDNYKKDSLDLSRYDSYAFNVDKSVPASYGRNRFQIVIARNPINYHLLDFTAKKSTGGITVNWLVDNEGDYTKFELEKQDANGAFYSLESRNSNGSGTYSYVDNAANTGHNFYRLKQYDIDGVVSYSEIKDVNLLNPTNSADLFYVYPNPAVEEIRVNLSSVPSSAYKVTIYNSMGAVVTQKTVSGISWSQNVSELKPGAYVIQLSDGKTGKNMGTKSFVKVN